MTANYGNPTYGNDPEYDAYVERVAEARRDDIERDPLGLQADRAAEREYRWDR